LSIVFLYKFVTSDKNNELSSEQDHYANIASPSKENSNTLDNPTQQEKESVVETLVLQECQGLQHWQDISDLKADLDKNNQLQLVWATWHGNLDNKKISWQFFLRPPAYTITDSLFFYLNENDVPIKQENVPAPFTSPIGQSIFDRIKLIQSTFSDSHWQFAITYSPNEKSAVAMMWEENEGFTNCEVTPTM